MALCGEVMSMAFCEPCGVGMGGVHWSRRFCDACRVDRHRSAARRWHRLKNVGSLQLNFVDSQRQPML